jgi:hypothetical protein
MLLGTILLFDEWILFINPDDCKFEWPEILFDDCKTEKEIEEWTLLESIEILFNDELEIWSCELEILLESNEIDELK